MTIGDNLSFIVRQPRLRSFSPDAAYIAETLEETDDFVEGAPIFAAEVRSKGDYGPASDAEYAASLSVRRDRGRGTRASRLADGRARHFPHMNDE